jgi:hypothetical protein
MLKNLLGAISIFALMLPSMAQAYTDSDNVTLVTAFLPLGFLPNGNTTTLSVTNSSTNISYANTYAASGRDQATSNTAWSHNLFYGGNAAYTLPGTGNVTTNPNFVSPGITGSANFNIQAGSPAINVASSTFTRTVNILGNPVATSGNVGAY